MPPEFSPNDRALSDQVTAIFEDIFGKPGSLPEDQDRSSTESEDSILGDLAAEALHRHFSDMRYILESFRKNSIYGSYQGQIIFRGQAVSYEVDFREATGTCAVNPSINVESVGDIFFQQSDETPAAIWAARVDPDRATEALKILAESAKLFVEGDHFEMKTIDEFRQQSTEPMISMIVKIGKELNKLDPEHPQLAEINSLLCQKEVRFEDIHRLIVDSIFRVRDYLQSITQIRLNTELSGRQGISTNPKLESRLKDLLHSGAGCIASLALAKYATFASRGSSADMHTRFIGMLDSLADISQSCQRVLAGSYEPDFHDNLTFRKLVESLSVWEGPNKIQIIGDPDLLSESKIETEQFIPSTMLDPLSSIFKNLISNAYKHSKNEATASVGISMVPREHENIRYLEIVVYDAATILTQDQWSKLLKGEEGRKGFNTDSQGNSSGMGFAIIIDALRRYTDE